MGRLWEAALQSSQRCLYLESVDLVVGRADNAKQKNHLHFFFHIDFQGLSFIIQDAISILMRRFS